jgi:hypothetical protein
MIDSEAYGNSINTDISGNGAASSKTLSASLAARSRGDDSVTVGWWRHHGRGEEARFMISRRWSMQ